MNQPDQHSAASTMFSDGAAYERLMGRWSQRVGLAFLDWLSLPPQLDWLDVGCGNGAFTEVALARGTPASVTGVDPSESQIAYARQRAGTKAAQFVIGDAQQLPFDAARFDVAVMALVIAFIPDPGRAVAELGRVTRPGGICASYMWDLPGGGVPLQPLHRALAAMGYPATMPPSVAASTQAGLHQLWTAAGFQDVAVQPLEITVAFDSFEDFWESSTQPVGPVAATIGKLSQTERASLRASLQASLPTKAAGAIAFPARANAVRGRRAA